MKMLQLHAEKQATSLASPNTPSSVRLDGNKTHLISHPLLRLCAEHALLSLWVPCGNQLLSKVVTDVAHDCLTLGNDNVLFRTSWSDGNSWRLSQGMHGFELGACALVGIALVDFDVVFEVELL